ncbi:hypothetical protein NQ315_001416 [Exocentrus adspersus]|uniref:Fibronectin type-III domain-containing protein n=1 Tax=Exocentrus adspersus TaxID=1586481 RepID=A0AAV8WGG1_9CUCU|nr:hypothetical protein NQ315_001416 [Exocentrus adspersus]
MANATHRFTIFLLMLAGINAEGCVPAMVENLRIQADARLTWYVDPDVTCVPTRYLVDIIGDREDEYHFSVSISYADLSFLNVCEQWEFVVRPVADEVIGFERRLTAPIPLPPSADISLKYFNVTQLSARDVLLEWDLHNHTHGDCSLHYRITIEDETTTDVNVLYATGRQLHIHNLSPCEGYRLGVRAVNQAHPIIEGPMKYHNLQVAPQPEHAPRMRLLRVGPTTIDMSWWLENSGNNRCPVQNFYVDGGNQFNITIPLEDHTPLDRDPVDLNLKGLRPNSMYYLRVAVENSAGLSPTVPIGVQTLELDPGFD